MITPSVRTDSSSVATRSLYCRSDASIISGCTSSDSAESSCASADVVSEVSCSSASDVSDVSSVTASYTSSDSAEISSVDVSTAFSSDTSVEVPVVISGSTAPVQNDWILIMNVSSTLTALKPLFFISFSPFL